MAADFKNSETKDNLMRAFAGESQARSRYTLFAKKAEEEGYQQIYVCGGSGGKRKAAGNSAGVFVYSRTGKGACGSIL